MLQQPGCFNLWVRACGSVAVSRLTPNQTKGRGDMIGAAVQDLTSAKCVAVCLQVQMPQGCVHARRPVPDSGGAVRAATAGPHL